MNPYDALLREHELDGRRVVGARNRLLAAGAALDLIREHGSEPSADDVAQRAGLSQRTVFRLFGDMDQLLNAAVRMQAARILPLLVIPAVTGSRQHRVRELVSARAQLYEQITPVRRVAMRHKPHQPAVSAGIDQLNAYLGTQLEQVFATEIGVCAPRSGQALICDLEVATSWAAWEFLRSDQHMSVRAAGASVARTIAALLLAASETARSQRTSAPEEGRRVKLKSVRGAWPD